jgi:hypothetical protein
LGLANENDQPYPCDDCCIEEEEECNTGCIDNNFPQQIQVVVAGLTNLDCDECTALNDTYIVDFVGFLVGDCASGSIDGCVWRYVLPESICDVTRVELLLTPAPSSFRVSFALCRGVNVSQEFRKTITPFAEQDCLGWSNYSLPFIATDVTVCGGLSKTCLITAL